MSRLEERLESIEARLARLEGGTPKPYTAPAAPPPAPAPVAHAMPPAQPAPMEAKTYETQAMPSPAPVAQATPLPQTAPAAAKPTIHPNWPNIDARQEEKPGNWLGIIAVICFVLAGGLIIKLSIDSGWLTPGRQISMAVFLGLSLVGAGLSLLERDREYAGLLPAAGVIILYLAAFAAHLYYGMIPFEAAIGATSLVSLLCVWLYIKIQHDVYAITAAIGSYVSPVLLGMHMGETFALFYFLLCSFAFAVISIWVQSRTLTVVAAYLAIIMTGLIGLNLGEDALVASMLALHFAIFTTGTYLYSVHNRLKLSEAESWSFLPILLIFYTMEYHFIDLINPAFAPWISLGFAGVLVALYLMAQNRLGTGLGSQSLILSFITIVLFHSVYLELLPEIIKPWLFALIMLALVVAPLKPASDGLSSSMAIPVLAVLAILGIEYIDIVSHLLRGANGLRWLPVAMVTFASIWVMMVSDKTNGSFISGPALLAAAHLLAIVAFYRLTTDIGSLAVSASWLFYGAAVMVFAFARRDNVMAQSALFVLAFAAAKALLFDAASAPTVVRILCLLLTGAVLYGCGFLMRRITSWR